MSTPIDLEIGEAIGGSTTTVDLEIGEATWVHRLTPPYTARSTAVDLEIGDAAPPPSTAVDLEIGRPKTRRNLTWFKVGMCTGVVSLPFYTGLIYKYHPYFKKFGHPLFPLLVWHLFSFAYIAFLFFVGLRNPLPCVLRRSQKLSIESVFVVVCSGWTLFERDGDILTAILGLIIIFKAIPVMNLWFDFENFDSMDCYVVVLIDAALVCCRYLGNVALMVVTCIGVAIHFVKDAYRHYSSQKIKNENQKHLI